MKKKITIKKQTRIEKIEGKILYLEIMIDKLYKHFNLYDEPKTTDTRNSR